MTVYHPADRPLIEVLINGAWYPGELRAWQRRGGGWWANVSWMRDGFTRLDTVPAGRVRCVDVSTSECDSGGLGGSE